MNRNYETMPRSARFALKGLAFSVMLAFGSSVHALPVGGVVSAGSANITSGGGKLTVNQASQNAAINWQSFSIGQSEAVRFVQPNSSSVALNRVLGADASSIMGSLSANGKVFLVNPNGILFGQGAQVNVAGLVASTRNISDSDFMAGNYRFAGSSNATILNQGTINADGGYVALLGANVTNEGVISARLGTVALAAGNAVTLDVAGDGLLNVMVNEGAVNALVQNGGMIRADGGQVLLTAVSAGNLLQSAVNNTGVIQAQTIDSRNGTIRLMGDMASGTVNVDGTLDASAPRGGNGGFIETSAAHVKVHDSARISTVAAQGTTGTWLIDPVDFTIGLGGDINHVTLSGQLVTSNVTITTVAGPGAGNGDIFVNGPVSWNGAAAPGATTTLTLNALRDVNVNAAITAVDGNLVICCGRDINVNAAVTTTRGSVLLSGGRDVNVVRSVVNPLTDVTTTDGNMQMCAGRNLNLDNSLNLAALLTQTRGTSITEKSLAGLGVPLGMTLSAGTGGTGPGPAGGTVVFANNAAATVNGPNAPVRVFYNPVSYTVPTPFLPKFTLTLGAALTQFMLVFPDGGSKAFDNTTATTLTGLKGIPPGIDVTLVGAGTANFDSAAIGVDKTVTFTGYSLGGANAGSFALANSCCGPAVGRTTANITPAIVIPVPPIVPVPPVVPVPPDVPVPPVLPALPVPVVVPPGTVVPPGVVVVLPTGVVVPPGAVVPVDVVVPAAGFVPLAVVAQPVESPSGGSTHETAGFFATGAFVVNDMNLAVVSTGVRMPVEQLVLAPPPAPPVPVVAPPVVPPTIPPPVAPRRPDRQ